jgi:hypothetical protein
MDQGDWTVILDSRCVQRLRQKHHERAIDLMEISCVDVPEHIERRHDIWLDDRPSTL